MDNEIPARRSGMAALEIPGYLIVLQPAIEVSMFTVISLVVFSAIPRAHLTDREKWRFGVTAAAVAFAWLLLMTGLSVVLKEDVKSAVCGTPEVVAPSE